jgi:hypothetical protein
MNSSLFMSVVLCVSSVACIAQDEDDVEIIATPKLAGNGLEAATMWATGPTLVAGPLNATNLAAMAADANKRLVLGYVIKCGLSSTQTVSVTVAGTTYSYTGQVGLATTWTTTALTTAKKRAVSACLLALVNEFGTNVTVSLRGLGLPLEGTEGASYGLREGAFWGDLFLGASSWGSACLGADQAIDPDYGDFVNRRCAQESAYGQTSCYYNYAGPCATACTGINDSTGYTGCSDGINPATSDVINASLSGHL